MCETQTYTCYTNKHISASFPTFISVLPTIKRIKLTLMCVDMCSTNRQVTLKCVLQIDKCVKLTLMARQNQAWFLGMALLSVQSFVPWRD
jgi:hypothetical protein